jgi:hypothetical protein
MNSMTQNFFKKISLFSVLKWIVVFVFLGIVLWGFPDSPSPWFDNGINLGLAKTFVSDGIYSLRLGPGSYIMQPSLFISTNYPLIGWIVLSFWIFGIGLWQAQMVMVIFLSLFLLFTYRIVLKLNNGNKVLSLGSVALVATFLPFYGHGLSGGLGEIPGLVYLFAGLLIYNRKERFMTVVAGLLFGLAATTKVIYFTVFAGVAVAEIWQAWRDRKIPYERWCLLILGALPTILVWGWSLLPHPLTREYLLQTYAYYHNPYKATSSFVWSNLKKFVTETTPIHFSILMGTVLGSIFIQKRSSKQGRDFTYIYQVLLVFAGLNWLWFLETPGWYRYFFPAHIVALVLFPGACFWLCQQVKNTFLKRYAAGFIIISLILVQFVYVLHERNKHLYFNPEPRRLVADLEQWVGSNADIYFLDQPELWFLWQGGNARQFIHMNSYVNFGEDFFATRHLPRYLVTGNHPEVNPYIIEHESEFAAEYHLVQTYGHYTIFSLK